MVGTSYLTAPEVENDRRSMNVLAGMRRGKKEGRYMGRAPFGYKHGRAENNKPCIVPGWDAELVQEAFEKMATGIYHIEELRKLMYAKGMKATKSTFWVLLRSPVYIGKVHIPAYKDEAETIVDGVHEALVTPELFYLVHRNVLDGRKARNRPANNTAKDELPLRGFVKCSKCGKNLTGSGSNGHEGRYFYYHCKDGCKERFRADAAHEQFFALLNLVSGNKKVLLTYERMLGATSKDGDAERKAELAKVNKEPELCRTRPKRNSWTMN